MTQKGKGGGNHFLVFKACYSVDISPNTYFLHFITEVRWCSGLRHVLNLRILVPLNKNKIINIILYKSSTNTNARNKMN
jgi:hypothetical protein